MAVVRKRHGADDVALVFDRLGGLCTAGSGATAEQRAPERHGRLPFFASPRNVTPRRRTAHPCHGVAKMPKAYWVSSYRSISDPQKLAAYAKLAPVATAPFGCRYLARGNPGATFEAG